MRPVPSGSKILGYDILGSDILGSASPVFCQSSFLPVQFSASVRAGQSHPVVPASVGNPLTVSLHPALQPGSPQPHVGGAASHLKALFIKAAIMQSQYCAIYLRICANVGLINAKEKTSTNTIYFHNLTIFFFFHMHLCNL